MEQSAAMEALRFPFLFLATVISMTSQIHSPGIHDEKLKKNQEVLLEYQVVVPPAYQDMKTNEAELVMILSQNGGKKSKALAKKLEKTIKNTKQVVVLVEKPSVWEIKDEANIKLLMEELSSRIKRLDRNKVKVITFKDGEHLVQNLACYGIFKYAEVYISTDEVVMPKCQNNRMLIEKQTNQTANELIVIQSRLNPVVPKG